MMHNDSSIETLLVSLPFASLPLSFEGNLSTSKLARSNDALEAPSKLSYACTLSQMPKGFKADFSLSGTVHLRCVRCEQGVDAPVLIESFYHLVNCDGMDGLADIGEDDFAYSGKTFSLLELFDEALMLDLPAFPSHESCERPLMQAHEDLNPTKLSPFAGLDSLLSENKIPKAQKR